MTTEVLSRFGKSIDNAHRRYRLFVEDGVAMGHRIWSAPTFSSDNQPMSPLGGEN
jgi:hypothetical protein